MRGTARRRRAREIRWVAANQQIGRRYATAIVFGRAIAIGWMALLAAAAAWWGWYHADWATVGQWARGVGREAAPWVVFAGMACMVGWMVWAYRSSGTLQSRLMARATRLSNRVGHLAPHLVGAAGLLLLIGGVMLWRPM